MARWRKIIVQLCIDIDDRPHVQRYERLETKRKRGQQKRREKPEKAPKGMAKVDGKSTDQNRYVMQCYRPRLDPIELLFFFSWTLSSNASNSANSFFKTSAR
jgi:hypothetical protein